MTARSRRTAAVLLALVLGAAGCGTWGRRPVPQPSSAEPLPTTVRVTRTDRSVLVLHEPSVQADSLVGFAGDASPRTRVAVPLSDVQRIDGRKVSVVRTAGTTLAVLAVGTVVLIGVTLAAFLGSWN